MGVAIFAYRLIIPTDQYGYSEDGKLITVYADKGFEHALDGMPDQTRPFEGHFIGGQMYETQDAYSECLSLSYGGYNRFRDALSEEFLLVHARTVWAYHDLFKGKPFFDLVHFSDAQGTLGPVACRRLADDFNSHENPFPRDGIFGSSYYKSYDTLKKLFNHAADTGLVQFG